MLPFIRKSMKYKENINSFEQVEIDRLFFTQKCSFPWAPESCPLVSFLLPEIRGNQHYSFSFVFALKYQCHPRIRAFIFYFQTRDAEDIRTQKAFLLDLCKASAEANHSRWHCYRQNTVQSLILNLSGRIGIQSQMGIFHRIVCMWGHPKPIYRPSGHRHCQGAFKEPCNA